jgi:NADH-quinone oxidoreductase subunit L
VLAVGSVALGGVLLIGNAFPTWLEPATGAGSEAEPVLPSLVITVLTLVVVALGLLLAFRMYLAQRVPEVQPRGSVAVVAARRDLFQDDVNEAVFMRPGQYLTRFLVFADLRGVDGAVRGAAAFIGGLAGRGRRWQTGFVRSYAMSMLAGVLVLALGVLVVQI